MHESDADAPRAARARIRTPDQRLRVFVSSTLQELAEERRAARAAIEGLHLNPVMFELGARPHPPRDLYRAYLEQSDVFVGIYWQRYGWVAPGEDVSGLEDEYRLSGDMPKLLYLKTPATREARLATLIERIQHEDAASYRPFGTPRELRELLKNDLALLLTERFDAGRVAVSPPPPTGVSRLAPPAPLPVPPTPLVGRERELRGVLARLAQPGVRLVTLLGPGGIGKTRLALAAAQELRARGQRVDFVDLSQLRDAALVPAAVARAYQLQTGVPPLDALRTALAGERALLVLDNFEQVVEAAPFVAALLEGLPDIQVLVSSRAALHLSGEHEYPLSPLTLPPESGEALLERARQSEAVDLFVQRARAVKPGFSLGPENALSVMEIVARLDGLPLAIELAAARVRLLPPAALLDRLQSALELGGARDRPERQRTVRATLDWSYGLLRPGEQALLARLGVFEGSASLEAIEAVCGPDGPGDLLGALEGLVEQSLLRQQDGSQEARFGLLVSVRDYAWEKLEGSGTLEDAVTRHEGFFLQLAEASVPGQHGAGQQAVYARLDLDRSNLWAAARRALERGRPEVTVRLAWALTTYLMVRGEMVAVRYLMRSVLTAGPGSLLAGRWRARAATVAGSMAAVLGGEPDTTAQLEAALGALRELGDVEGEARTLLPLGMSYAYGSPPDGRAAATLEAARAIAHARGDTWLETMTLGQIGLHRSLHGDLPGAFEAYAQASTLAANAHLALPLITSLIPLAFGHLLRSDPAGAARHLQGALERSLALGYRDGVAWVLEGSAALAVRGQRPHDAARLLGAAAACRRAFGSSMWMSTNVLVSPYLQELQERLGEAALSAAEQEGEALSQQEALALAREVQAQALPGAPA